MDVVGRCRIFVNKIGVHKNNSLYPVGSANILINLLGSCCVTPTTPIDTLYVVDNTDLSLNSTFASLSNKAEIPLGTSDLVDSGRIVERGAATTVASTTSPVATLTFTIKLPIGFFPATEQGISGVVIGHDTTGTRFSKVTFDEPIPVDDSTEVTIEYTYVVSGE